MHKAFGITMLSLVVIRILWRITNTTVQAAEGVPTILQLAAKAGGHLLLYIFMLVMPISGVLMSRFGGSIQFLYLKYSQYLQQVKNALNWQSSSMKLMNMLHGDL